MIDKRGYQIKTANNYELISTNLLNIHNFIKIFNHKGKLWSGNK